MERDNQHHFVDQESSRQKELDMLYRAQVSRDDDEFYQQGLSGGR